METQSRRGRPRSEKSRRATLAATAELVLEQGDVRVSMDAVAEHAGVSKATIYRWWPSKEMLVLDALQDWVAAGIVARDTGSLRGDLNAVVLPWVGQIRGRAFARVISALIAEAQLNPEFADVYQSHFINLRREPARMAIARAIARGEVSKDLDVEAAIDLLYGPIYHRLLNGHAPLTQRFATTVVGLAVAGIVHHD
jgi:AcrR family transcriptional regulator